MTYNTFTKFTFLFFTLLTVSCQKENLSICPEKSGTIEVITLELEEFHSIHLYLQSNTNIYPAEKHTLSIKGDPQILNQLEIFVEHNTLKIANQYQDCFGINDLEIEIGVPHLKHLLTTQKSSIKLHPFSSMQSCSVNLTDKTVLDFIPGENLHEMEVRLSDGAKIVSNEEYAKKIDALNINIIGEGYFTGYPLEAQKVDINIRGSGVCKVSAEEKLDVVIYGDAKVICKGMPHFYKRITGSGKVYFTD